MLKPLMGIALGLSLLMGAGIDEMFSQVEKLKVSLGGYTIGQALNDAQWKSAQEHKESANVPGTYKFQDGDYHVVVDSVSRRILVVYRQYDDSDRAALKSTIGTMMMDYEEPTTMTHGKILYWFYNHKGKMSQSDLDQHKEGIKSPQTLKAALSEEKESQKSEPILSLKLSSSADIMPGTDPHKPAPAESNQNEKVSFYVIAASEAILKHYVQNQ